MKKLGVFMADGCEEIEALTVVDLARRVGIEVAMISINGRKEVTGSHGIVFQCDIPAEYMDYEQLDGIVLPGGMPGTLNLGQNSFVQETIVSFAQSGKLVAAICAAPSILGMAGLLKGKRAVCYPGFEEQLFGAEILTYAVVSADNIITSRGMGTAIDFGLRIVSHLIDDETASQLKRDIIHA